LTASILTIPLYKIVCNISIQENIGNMASEWVSCDMYNEVCVLDVSYNETTKIYMNGNVDIVMDNIDKMSNVVKVFQTKLLINKEYNICSIIKEDEKKIYIKCISHVSNYSPLEFISLQDNIVVFPGESSLIFFRLYNPTSLELTSISIYFVYPSNAGAYVNKIQCFCFDQVTIKCFETVELPVLFNIDKRILLDKMFEERWYFAYVLFVQR
jgi:hypothetical protein